MFLTKFISVDGAEGKPPNSEHTYKPGQMHEKDVLEILKPNPLFGKNGL